MVLGYIPAPMRHSRQPTTAVLTLLLLGLVVATPTPAKLRPIKLAAQAGRVKKGTEKQTCFPIDLPRDHEVDVDHVQIFVHGGSHHVHLYRPTAGPVEYPNPDKTYSPAGPHNRRPRDCAFAIDFSHWELVAATQSANLNWQLHPGVGIHFLPQQPLLIQTHFVNTGFGSAELAVEGTRGPLVYENVGYSDPKFQQYSLDDTRSPLEGGKLELQPGEGLEWACTWQNDSTETFPFGPNTQKNEHCNLFGFYYPTDDPLEAIDCVHKEDGSEVRILAR